MGVGQIGGRRTILLGGGSAYPEVLAAAPLSHAYGAPVLLTDAAHLSGATQAAIVQLRPERVIILGDEGRVGPAVAQQVSALGVEVSRITGANPLDSARTIADSLVGEFGFDAAEVVLARGDDVGDAVAGGVLAGVRNAPIALAESPGSLGVAATTLQDNCTRVEQLTVLGGEAALTGGVVDAATAATDCLVE